MSEAPRLDARIECRNMMRQVTLGSYNRLYQGTSKIARQLSAILIQMRVNINNSDTSSERPHLLNTMQTDIYTDRVSSRGKCASTSRTRPLRKNSAHSGPQRWTSRRTYIKVCREALTLHHSHSQSTLASFLSSFLFLRVLSLSFLLVLFFSPFRR